MNKSVMCHLVAGFPNPEACLDLMQKLSATGLAALEVQIPFSDPIADGETIMRANDTALENAMTTAGSFDLLEQARARGVDSDLYIMSYVQKVRHFGMAEFCERAAAVRTKGLIIPDLPYDSPEFSELRGIAGRHGLELVPVLSPGMPETRLQAVLALQPPAVYITSRRGITGKAYAPDHHLKEFTAAVKKLSEAKLMIGFGLTSRQDVDDALELGDTAVVGSALVSRLQSSGVDETAAYARSLITDEA